MQGVFHNLRFFTPPLNARYGPSTSAAEYLFKSQAAIYESHRAFFEGYSRNKYTSTGLIQWMLNSPWPSNIWHLYDYYLGVGGTFFATRKACEDLHVMYANNDRSVWVINSLYTAVPSVNVTVEVRNITGAMVFTKHAALASAAPDSAVQVAQIPTLFTTNTYFVRLIVTSPSTRGNINDYWLSTRPDVLDWATSTFYTTFCKQYGNLTQLNSLPTVSLTLTPKRTATGYAVTVANPTVTIAFMVQLRANLNGTEALPVLWDDNFLVLVAHEARIVNVEFPQLTQAQIDALQFVYTVYNNVVKQ